MLLGGKGGCQQCTCVPCDACTRTCQNPHTGDAFEAVYTRYFEGAEDGNVSDGYLTASGDSDTSDPYDGMDGNGPWFQQVAGEFTLDPSTTRHPCGVTVSFWRNNYTLGASTIPPPATTTTMNRIRVSVSALSETGVFVEGDLIGVGQTVDLNMSIALVTGSGDQSANDPKSYEGGVTVTPQCHNKTATFTISGRIEWNVKKRQHILYGLVRECYQEASPCSCPSGPFNEELYVEVSGFTDEYNLGIDPDQVNGTYVAERFLWCDFWVFEHGVFYPGALSFTTPPLRTTNFGYQRLRYYVLWGFFPMTTTGVNYQCGTGDMATVTVDISLWFIYEFGSSDLNAGTITVRVFK
jgi:hypothetical protein